LKDMGGYTALLRALEKKNDAIAELLLSQPNLDLNAQGFSGTTALMSYVWNSDEANVQKLIERGANPNLHDADGDTALHGAAMRGNVRMLQMLVNAGADLNAKNKAGGTPLMWAAVYGYRDAAKFLIEKGSNAALKDETGMTAAKWAARSARNMAFRVITSSGRESSALIERRESQYAGAVWTDDRAIDSNRCDQPAACGRHVYCGIRQSMPSSR
jgi:ankyrin repeat protein